MVEIMFRKHAQQLLKTFEGRVRRPLALAYRVVLLPRVTFIGVTGSTGKTTTKELIAAVLSRHLAGAKSEQNNNVNVHNSIHRSRPWHKYYVQEIAAAVGGERVPLERPLAVVRPHIGVVTNIGTDHLKVFGSMDEIAAEKGKLVASLPESGAAILNADDPLVLAMQARCRCRVITYGLSRQATIRAENVRSTWPERLSFDLLHDGRRITVRTRLCGTHWVTSALAAIGTAVAAGLSPEDAARAIETVPPVNGRMQPVVRPDGVTFIRDNVKAPLWSIPSTLEFLRSANARRKIAVIGTISDYTGNSTKRYSTVAKQFLDVADLVLFVGPKASKGAKGKNHPKGDALQAFPSVEAARSYLGAVLRPGDLVLLKGSGYREGLGKLCSVELGGEPAEPGRPDMPPLPAPAFQEARRRPASGARMVMGFGNPEEAYRDTPHNVGHRVLDRIAEDLGVEWERREKAWIASAEWKGTSLHLVKPMTPVNHSGPVLLELCEEAGLGPADCWLVQDDLDLPFATCRIRRRGGSDGGHKGVRSVLQAFGTDQVARMKIGVGRSDRSRDAARYVVMPFRKEERAEIEVTCIEAAARLLKQVRPMQSEADR